LCEIADARARGRFDPAAIRLVEASDQLEQSRFARPVAANQPDAGFRRQRRRCPIENEVAPQAERYAVKNEHGNDFASERLEVNP
jgi:hypothetical protein